MFDIKGDRKMNFSIWNYNPNSGTIVNKHKLFFPSEFVDNRKFVKNFNLQFIISQRNVFKNFTKH